MIGEERELAPMFGVCLYVLGSQGLSFKIQKTTHLRPMPMMSSSATSNSFLSFASTDGRH